VWLNIALDKERIQFLDEIHKLTLTAKFLIVFNAQTKLKLSFTEIFGLNQLNCLFQTLLPALLRQDRLKIL